MIGQSLGLVGGFTHKILKQRVVPELWWARCLVDELCVFRAIWSCAALFAGKMRSVIEEGIDHGNPVSAR